MNKVYKIKPPKFVAKYRYLGSESLTIENSPIEIDIHQVLQRDEHDRQFYIYMNACLKGRGTLDEMKEMATDLYYQEIQKYLIEA